MGAVNLVNHVNASDSMDIEKNRDSGTVSPVKAELSAEDQKLAALGYTQVYQREFSMLATFSFALSISGVFATVTTTFSYPLAAGGAASAVWCWLISGAGCMCIALSVAELVSAYPTSGGLYFTCKHLAPERWVPEISWVCGWFNLLGQIAGCASTDYGCAQLLLAAVAIGSDFTYTPTNRHTVGVMAAIVVMHGVINSASTKYLERITRSYVIIHILVLVSCIIALLACTPDKHEASYTFTHVESTSGWTPVGFSFLFGFLSASWTMTDYDATAHIAEEIKDASIKAPWAIASALGFTYVAGWIYTIVLVICMGDPNAPAPAGIMNSPIEQPVAQLFYNRLGKGGGIFFTVAAFIILNTTGITAFQSASRTVWAFSRDGLLPFSNIWYKMDRRTDTPLYATWLCIIFTILINLIALGSYIAISAIFNVCAIALDYSYCIPIVCKLMGNKFERGPWHLGRFSFAINLIAVVWTVFVSIIFMMPTAMPVEADEMNYASVILAAIGLFSFVYWFIRGRGRYHGPTVKTFVIEEPAGGVSE
ncbi:MAG: hypothetical protein M1818_007676 [Claussenomyces sp. TS43310]|nr:MAG: hypothetical protein M1818_007676 [Claussenomyces sp. TS43310]